MNILDKIVQQRRDRISRSGHTMGEEVPARRQAPLSSFPSDPFIICEVKRRSPSAGSIQDLPEPQSQVEMYVRGGAGAVSVLTESDHFGGSLRDLISLKKRYPDTCFLRKDFLLDPEDIEVSWRAGADAVLLIAAILENDRLEMLYRLARGYGMEVLLEVHTAEEIGRIKNLRPETVGINARNLEDFSVDLLRPVRLSPLIDWKARMVFESGIRSPEDSRLAFSAGFDAVLVGEAVMRQPVLLPALRKTTGRSGTDTFWGPLFRRALSGRRPQGTKLSSSDVPPSSGSSAPAYKPLVKICGLTRIEDVRAADELGADILGFVCAPSPRRADPDFIRHIGETAARKVAVVVLNSDQPELPPYVAEMLQDGTIDAVQFHGDEKPEECFSTAFPYYKALRIRDRADIPRVKAYSSPRVLVDAYSPAAYGGTGQCINADLIPLIAREKPLWLAGGIGPRNVSAIINAYQPELIDASSSLEAAPGQKDIEKMKDYFGKIERASELAEIRRSTS